VRTRAANKKRIETDPKTRIVFEDVPICPNPLLLQARRIWLAHIDKVALEPVGLLGPGQVLQRRANRGDAAARDNVKHVCGGHSTQCQRHGKQGANDWDEQLEVSTDFDQEGAVTSPRGQVIVHLSSRIAVLQVVRT
jgi:hypothetical protein